MSNSNKKLIDLSHTEMQLLNVTDKNYRKVFCIFKYANQKIEKIVSIPSDKKQPNSYYLKKAKECLQKEKENGKLVRYSKKYLRKLKHPASPKLKVCIITSAAILGVGGVGVGAYFLGKALNPGRGGGDKLVEVTFDANSTVEHPAYFNGDENLHKLKFSVAKGTKFGDVKKMARDISRLDDADDKTSTYYSPESWTEITSDNIEVSKIADEHIINDDLRVKADYKKDTVKITLIAGANDSGYFRVNNTTNPPDLALRVFSFDIPKGMTLSEALNIAPPGGEIEYVKPVIIDYEDDPTYDLKCYFDVDQKKEIYIGYNSKFSEELEQPVKRDLTLYSIFNKTPGGEAKNWMNVTLYATRPGTDQNPSLYENHYNYSGNWKVREDTIKDVTLSFPYDSEEESWTWTQIEEKIANILEIPVGIYGGFEYWEDTEGNKIKGTDVFSHDIVAYAHYTPNFANDSWQQIINNANMGKQRIIDAYGLQSENEIYNLKKVSASDAYVSQVIGVNTDFQNARRVHFGYDMNPYAFYEPSALTMLIMVDPSGAPTQWFNTDDYPDDTPEFVNYENEKCKVRWKADYITDYFIDEDLLPFLNNSYKTINVNGKPTPPTTYPSGYKVFPIGGYEELKGSHISDVSDLYSFQKMYLTNKQPANVTYHLPDDFASRLYFPTWTRFPGQYLDTDGQGGLILKTANSPTEEKRLLLAFSIGDGSM